MRCYLTGLGRLPWVEAISHLEDMTCAWADLDGWHEEPPPEEAPLTSIMWAWSHDRWSRLRIDGDSAILALLTVESAEPDGEPVEVEVIASMPWGEDPRLPAVSRQLGLRNSTRLVVTEPHRLTFVHGDTWTNGREDSPPRG